MKYLIPCAMIALSGCSQLESVLSPAPQPAPSVAVTDAPPPPSEAARTVEQFDTTTAEQRAAAAAPSSTGRAIGTAVATLGDPAQPGFWVETALVSAPGMGRITSTETGKSVEVELRPSSGGSARVSLAAWRLLEVPLTDLSEITIFSG